MATQTVAELPGSDALRTAPKRGAAAAEPAGTSLDRTSTSATPEAHKERDSVIDNARFLLIGLVVLGHFLTTLRGSPALDVLYSWIYMFHMPAFVFLSGVVINSEAVAARQGSRIVSGLIAPLVIFTVLYELFGRLLGQPVPTDSNLMDPYWLLWFLVALTIWRLLVPVLKSLRWPVATTLVIASTLVLVSDLPAEWSIDRVVVLLPFFTAGLVLTPERLRALRNLTWRLIGAGILLFSIPAAIWATQLPGGFITFSDGVRSIGDIPEFLVMYGIAAAMIVAVLALVPSRRSVMTTWGTRTIYVYLLHGLFVRAFRATELNEVLMTPTGAAIVVVASLGLAILLSSNAVVRLTERIVEPKVTWLLRDDLQPRPGAKGGSLSQTPDRGSTVSPDSPRATDITDQPPLVRERTRAPARVSARRPRRTAL